MEQANRHQQYLNQWVSQERRIFAALAVLCVVIALASFTLDPLKTGDSSSNYANANAIMLVLRCLPAAVFGVMALFLLWMASRKKRIEAILEKMLAQADSPRHQINILILAVIAAFLIYAGIENSISLILGGMALIGTFWQVFRVWKIKQAPLPESSKSD
ncbi:hypothetical protein MASR2M15_04140 [Anaerolineales bacterium]